MSCSSSNSRVGVDADLDKNVLTITPYSVGKTTVTVSINDQQICKLTINTILVQMSTNSALLAIKETKQLSVKGAPAVATKWSSTNPKVVTVSSKGLVRAKSSGNAVIKAKIGDNMFRTGDNNGRYKGIYHVEMIVGYTRMEIVII